MIACTQVYATQLFSISQSNEKKKKQPTECEYNEVRSIIIFSNGVVFRLESIQLEKLKGRNAHTSKHTGV